MCVREIDRQTEREREREREKRGDGGSGRRGRGAGAECVFVQIKNYEMKHMKFYMIFAHSLPS